MSDSEIRTVLANNIKGEFAGQGIGLREFAIAVGSRSQVYDIVAGKKGCTVDMLDRIAAVLCVNTFELLKKG